MLPFLPQKHSRPPVQLEFPGSVLSRQLSGFCSDKGNFRAQIFPPGHAEKAENMPNESKRLHTPACGSPASEWEPQPTCAGSYSLSQGRGESAGAEVMLREASFKGH